MTTQTGLFSNPMNSASSAPSPTFNKDADWSAESAKKLYNIESWGANYFDIDKDGKVFAQPLQNGAKVAIADVVQEAMSRNLRMPLLIRFQDILRHRVETLNKVFQKSIKEYDYKGRYRAVFPIKVNQLREVVEEIIDAGEPFGLGIEVGSKPELFAGLALQSEPGKLIVCNGYKDPLFIKMALLGVKLGKRVVMVVEKLEELSQIIQISRALNVEPIIGIRVRLYCKGAGKWAESAGEDAKFGLSTVELVRAAELLKQEGMSHCFKLLHFHIGSQVPDIVTIKRAVQEGARFYTKLHKMGFGLEMIDVGGGLAVDYDGSRSAFDSSMNYSLQEYANDIVYYVGNICDNEGVPHPEIISESGRALVAHHSVLIVDCIGSISKTDRDQPFTYGENEHNKVKELLYMRDHLDKMSPLEAYHDAMEHKEEAHQMFMLGYLDITDKAKIERLYWEISENIVKSFRGKGFIPEEITELNDSLGDQYLCNFSVFQSLLDHWAVGQLFPIMPIERLNEKPTREATLVDITCDSEGEVRKFIDLEDVRDTLPLHELVKDSTTGKTDPYRLGFFLMGAYQDIMGDLHNLFGRVNEAHVFLDPDEPAGYYIEEIIRGSEIQHTLASVQYDSHALKRQVKAQVDKAIREDRLKPSEAMKLFSEYERGLSEYTYLGFQSDS